MRLAARHGGCLAGVEPTARTPLQGGTPWWEQTRVPHTLLKRFAQHGHRNAFEQAELILPAALDPALVSRASRGAFVRQIFPPDLDEFFLLSSHKSAICRDPRGVMLLSTLPPVWEGHLQGLENPGLLRIGTGQARHAVGLIKGIGEQTETIERG